MDDEDEFLRLLGSIDRHLAGIEDALKSLKK